jgi:O-antigen/teichoic acid export membrane protein
LIGSLLLILVILGARLAMSRSASLELVLAIGAADLVFVRFVDVSGQAYQAVQRLQRTAQLHLLLSVLRLVASVGLILSVTAPTALDWSVLYLVSAVVGSAFALILVSRELGRPRFELQAFHKDWWKGLAFSVGMSAQSWNDNLDKTMLARLGTLEATGVYGAGFRVVQVAFVPIYSLLAAAYARFFQHGVQGVRATARFASRLLSLGVCYGLLATAALYLIAPVLPAILGDEYQRATEVVRWLAVLPLLKAIQYFGADALTGAGYQGLRTMVQVSIAVVNVCLNVWLIPLYSWRGAAVAAVVSDGLLGVAIWTAVGYLSRHGHRLKSPEQAHSVVQVG